MWRTRWRLVIAPVSSKFWASVCFCKFVEHHEGLSLCEKPTAVCQGSLWLRNLVRLAQGEEINIKTLLQLLTGPKAQEWRRGNLVIRKGQERIRGLWMSIRHQNKNMHGSYHWAPYMETYIGNKWCVTGDSILFAIWVSVWEVHNIVMLLQALWLSALGH